MERSLALNSREEMSAGFKSPGQCLQESGDVKLQISSTRCCTNCFDILAFLIQHKAVKESIQLMVFNCFTVELNLLTSRAKRTAPRSFKRGIDCFFSGATLDFEETRRTSIRPSE